MELVVFLLIISGLCYLWIELEDNEERFWDWLFPNRIKSKRVGFGYVYYRGPREKKEKIIEND